MSVSIFFCYAHEDEALLNRLKAQLRPLVRQGLIDIWYDRDISAGMEWDQEINKHLNEAKIILLLVSPDFMDSDYIYGTEMKRAIERHQRGEARVIPIILRAVYWQGSFGNLQALPTDAKPVKSWPDIDEAFFNVTEGIRTVVEQLEKVRLAEQARLAAQERQAEEERARQEKEQADELEEERVHKAKEEGTHLPQPPGTSPANMLPPRPPQRGLSRRTVVVGLAGLAVAGVAGGGIIWLTHSQSYIGTTLYTYHGHSKNVDVVPWSPDGHRIASGSWDMTVQVWDASNGINVYTYHGHSDAVRAVAWSPDSHRIASGSVDKTVQVWDAADGGHAFTYHGHSKNVDVVPWSPDGHRIASGSWDMTVQVWQAS
jgi:TIR domain/WD domain, G-beta repeat